MKKILSLILLLGATSAPLCAHGAMDDVREYMKGLQNAQDNSNSILIQSYSTALISLIMNGQVKDPRDSTEKNYGFRIGTPEEIKELYSALDAVAGAVFVAKKPERDVVTQYITKINPNVLVSVSQNFQDGITTTEVSNHRTIAQSHFSKKYAENEEKISPKKPLKPLVNIEQPEKKNEIDITKKEIDITMPISGPGELNKTPPLNASTPEKPIEPKPLPLQGKEGAIQYLRSQPNGENIYKEIITELGNASEDVFKLRTLIKSLLIKANKDLDLTAVEALDIIAKESSEQVDYTLQNVINSYTADIGDLYLSRWPTAKEKILKKDFMVVKGLVQKELNKDSDWANGYETAITDVNGSYDFKALAKNLLELAHDSINTFALDALRALHKTRQGKESIETALAAKSSTSSIPSVLQKKTWADVEKLLVDQKNELTTQMDKALQNLNNGAYTDIINQLKSANRWVISQGLKKLVDENAYDKYDAQALEALDALAESPLGLSLVESAYKYNSSSWLSGKSWPEAKKKIIERNAKKSVIDLFETNKTPSNENSYNDIIKDLKDYKVSQEANLGYLLKMAYDDLTDKNWLKAFRILEKTTSDYYINHLIQGADLLPTELNTSKIKTRSALMQALNEKFGKDE